MALKEDVLSSDALNVREKTIIDFVSENPGATKQKVVDSLDGKYSRVIIFDTIKDLERYDIIIVQKNKPNTRIHNLYINERNQILIESKRLLQFQAAMMDLLEKIKKEDVKLTSQVADDVKKLQISEKTLRVLERLRISYQHKQISKKELENQSIKQVNDILKDLTSSEALYKQTMYSDMFFRLLRIFWKVLQVYNFEALFIWPTQVSNKLYSNKLIHNVFNQLIDIQLKMAQMINEVSLIQGKYTEQKGYGFKPADIYKQSLEHLKKEISFFQLSFEEESKVFQDHGLGKEIENVLNSIYPITKDLFVQVPHNPNE